MDITSELMIELATYICPVHGEATCFKVRPASDAVILYCCEFCKMQIEDIINGQFRAV